MYTVENVMSDKVVTIAPEASVREAMRRMASEDVPALIVRVFPLITTCLLVPAAAVKVRLLMVVLAPSVVARLPPPLVTLKFTLVVAPGKAEQNPTSTACCH